MYRAGIIGMLAFMSGNRREARNSAVRTCPIYFCCIKFYVDFAAYGLRRPTFTSGRRTKSDDNAISVAKPTIGVEDAVNSVPLFLSCFVGLRGLT